MLSGSVLRISKACCGSRCVPHTTRCLCIARSTDAVPCTLAGCQNLGRVSLPPLGQFCNMEDLNLANNRLATAQGWGIEELTRLRRLDLHGNKIADPVDVRARRCCCLRRGTASP